jgi:hypothetical protein
MQVYAWPKSFSGGYVNVDPLCGHLSTSTNNKNTECACVCATFCKLTNEKYSGGIDGNMKIGFLKYLNVHYFCQHLVSKILTAEHKET